MSQDIKEYRNSITLHLTRISADLEHIKEKVNDNNKHLLRLNGRVTETEKQISSIKGMGGAFVFIIGSVLTWLGIEK